MPRARPAGMKSNSGEMVYRVPLGQLLLDPENPRLASSRQARSPDDLVDLLWTEMHVIEIALSIAANGYLVEEPLLVYWEPKKGKYIVVEGNRRLAAVRLLREPKLRKKVGAEKLPRLSGKKIRDLDTLPVSLYPNRKSLWKYTGFRHINGPKPWDAYSKAKYVANVLEKYGVSLNAIAHTIGDTHATVVRLYRGYKILQQAEKQAGFNREDRVKTRFAFSHLYTATASPGFQKFLGITPQASLRANPIPRTKRNRLAELMTWLYGRKSKGIEPVVRTQNPDLWTLEEVISNPESLSALRSRYSLDTAHEISIGDEQRFREALTAAKEELRQARGSVIGYTGADDEYGTMNDIVKLAIAIRSDMESVRSSSHRKRPMKRQRINIS